MKKVALLAILTLLPADVFAAPAQRVCMAANGSIAVRAKCLAKERQLSAGVIQSLAVGAQGAQGPIGPTGPQGPAGSLNITACHPVKASDTATENTSGVIGVTARCQTGEFILNYGIAYSQHSANLEQATLFSSDGMVADGVGVLASQEAWVCFTRPEYCNYTLTVTATCCPR